MVVEDLVDFVDLVGLAGFEGLEGLVGEGLLLALVVLEEYQASYLVGLVDEDYFGLLVDLQVDLLVLLLLLVQEECLFLWYLALVMLLFLLVLGFLL